MPNRETCGWAKAPYHPPPVQGPPFPEMKAVGEIICSCRGHISEQNCLVDDHMWQFVTGCNAQNPVFCVTDCVQHGIFFRVDNSSIKLSTSFRSFFHLSDHTRKPTIFVALNETSQDVNPASDDCLICRLFCWPFSMHADVFNHVYLIKVFIILHWAELTP